MKLSEIKTIRESITQNEFVIQKWDGHEPVDMYVKPFDVKVTYEREDLGHSYHPYGEGSAREDHGVSASVLSIETAEVVEIMDEEGDKILQTFPVGTPVHKIPGWNEDSAKWFQRKAEEHAQE